MLRETGSVAYLEDTPVGVQEHVEGVARKVKAGRHFERISKIVDRVAAPEKKEGKDVKGS